MDFSRRVEPAELAEWMDEACSYEEFRDCLRDLERVNRLSMGYRPTLGWLEGVAAGLQAGETLRIVDVGCGGGDMLRQVADWARLRAVKVELVGVDLNPFAARVARELGGEDGREQWRGNTAVLRRWLRMTAKNNQQQESGDDGIRWVTGDAFSLEGEVDVVISSLFTHHLPTAEVVRFVGWMESVARRGWFVNDLERAAVPYYAFGVMAKVAGWHKFVQHDGPVSFRRAFSVQDWWKICGAAKVVDGVEVKRWTPARLCVGRVK